jgi:hypothetical protein
VVLRLDEGEVVDTRTVRHQQYETREVYGNYSLQLRVKPPSRSSLVPQAAGCWGRIGPP